MRLLKENRRAYLPFLNSVEQLEKASDGKYKLKKRTNLPLACEQVSVISGGNVQIDLLAFSEKLNSLYQSEQIIAAFKDEISKLSFFMDAEIFSLDDKTSECKPIDKTCNQKLYYYVKNFLKNGILDWVAESKNAKFLPWEVDNAAVNSGLTCFVVPIFSNNRFSGVLASLTNLKYLSEDSFEYRTLLTILNQTFAKLEFVRLRDELNKTYSEYQILQSKLFNDFKFAAIGELTSKSIEEIGSPLQVIMSYSDLLQKENPDLDSDATDFIRNQVHTIKEILDRLGNFINNSDSKPKLYSCSINTAINDFYKVIEHSLRADSCECVLDLEENIPSILSNYNSLKQILINSFSLINPLRGTGGGIIIQSRYSSETIIIKMLFTDTIDGLAKEDKEFGINILKHLMDKHEGEMRFISESGTGTNLIFSFPLKRKMRE
ncbi:MAG: HAMP domain-containing histidine kinase [Ignavibacteriales bacterium]|nr:HAMP domain-containing histidine kinase [Ignavibacteriales bacterium]